MKDLVKGFLSEEDNKRIIESVGSAEKRTSGEIVPMVVSSSGRYSYSAVIGALVLSVPLAAAGAHLIGPLLGAGTRDMWVFLGLGSILFVAFHVTVAHVPWFRKLFISRDEMRDRVRRAALANFYLNGLHRTRDETGVLIFVSIFERTVWVLGDRGINEKVGAAAWEEIVGIVTEGMKRNRQADAICRAVERAGEILQAHFPVRPDDRDELPNLIRGE